MAAAGADGEGLFAPQGAARRRELVCGCNQVRFLLNTSQEFCCPLQVVLRLAGQKHVFLLFLARVCLLWEAWKAQSEVLQGAACCKGLVCGLH